MDDFCRCTPSEYYAAYEAWHGAVDAAERGKWERVRMQCLCILQPYSKDKLKARDIMQFAWDKEVQTEIPEVKEKLRGLDYISLDIVVFYCHESPK